MAVSDYESVIGLEVHCQLKTASKMFSACGVALGVEPNTMIDAYTLGLPGTLPTPNIQAVRFGVALALAAHCEVQATSRFARKHYFYPDLPKGYQISQSDEPYAVGGWLEVPGIINDEGGPKRVRLVRIHIEEDAGKNVHVPGENVSLLDYNRAGSPLLEIVSEPDIRSAEEAAAYMKELRTIVRTLGLSDANMEQGTLRCDANVSIRPRGSERLGTRCEIKNLNSFRFLAQAIEAEIRRQADIIDGGGQVQQATLSFDPDKGRTRVMRLKEEAADYRYMPEPDMPPLVIPSGWVEEIKAALPELPAARRARYRALGLADDDVMLLAGEPTLGSYFDRTLEAGGGAPTAGFSKKACSWITVELMGKLNADSKEVGQSPVSPEHLADLVQMLEAGEITGRSAKAIFTVLYEQGDPAQGPRQIAERDGHRQLSDASALEAVVSDVLKANPKQVEQYKGGKTKVRGFFVGQIMKKTRGQANPQVVNELLDRLLPKPQG